MLIVAAQLIFFYAAFVGLLFMFQRYMIYHPDNGVYTPQQAGLDDMSVISVHTADGLTLSGWYKAPADAAKPVILFYHGNGGSIANRGYKVRDFMTAGYGVLLAEYRGYGGNPGNWSEQGFYEDARAYIQWLNQHNVAVSHIVLLGESLGTGVAVQMAVEYPQALALVLESPYTSLPDVGARRFFYIPVHLLMTDRYDSLSKIGQVHMPLLIIHGRQDDVVDYALGKALYDAAHQPKQMLSLPQAGHNDLYAYGAGPDIVNFLETLKIPSGISHNLPSQP